MAGNLVTFYNLAVSLCRKTNPPCLYSMDYNNQGMNGLVRRMGGTFLSDPWYGTMGSTPDNPIQYFDCSGFVSYCLWQAGYTDHNLGFTTSYELSCMSQIGWKIYTYHKGMTLREGDIVWYDTGGLGHTEIVFNPTTRQTMGASGRGTPWGNAPTKDKENQVRILDTDTDSVYNWMYLARDESATGVNLEWVYKDEYLTDSETMNNITLAVNILVNEGYSMNAVSGIVGNMWAESGVEPWLTERGGGGGYGLVQWTPKQDLIDAVTRNNLGDYTKGDVQCKVIAYEAGWKGTNTQWYDIYPHKPDVPFTNFETWAKRTDYSPEQMAYAFMSYYERPNWEYSHLDRRMDYAKRVFDMMNKGMFNGQLAFNTNVGGTVEDTRRIVLIDYVRRKNSLRTS